VHVPPGVIVNAAVTVPPSCAVIVADVVVLTAEVPAVNVALVCPCGTTTLEGTLAAVLLLERKTPAPPEGAAMFRVTVPVDELPPATDAGFIVSPATDRVGAVPHTPAVPPPPQVWPKSHPQARVPPQPSAIGPHVPGVMSRHVFGEQPAFTVSGFVTGTSPAAPDAALIVTVVVCGTDFAA
jgi:hypothetical protein